MSTETKLLKIKSDIYWQADVAVQQAFELGQSEDVTATKAELEETLKHAQEAYEFFKVVLNRFCISENHLESTTMSYLREIGSQLEKIRGVKK
ncbi:hypothetical protein F993_01681 [Acinetobacter proteolyticus]|uniref:Uncharacterized protein n=1 Tax=Acinetobacter proteolyticus TaxID=1776741 RepID=A0ABN0JED6_9GAMM|nr:hypothetical protein [Acinetobacter proteolyticus]ENU23528.1 hypothetical protein F993_01681 [Acinetobacter proteolyticus]